MKAAVSYNDFIGTSAADISDHTDLNEFLTEQGVDTQLYKPIGLSFYTSYDDLFFVSFLCVDAERSTAEKPFVVKMSFENELSQKDFFALFKRLEVVLMFKYDNHGQMNRQYPDEEMTFANKKNTGAARQHRNQNDGRNR
jgi:hypothetical protein